MTSSPSPCNFSTTYIIKLRYQEPSFQLLSCPTITVVPLYSTCPKRHQSYSWQKKVPASAYIWSTSWFTETEEVTASHCSQCNHLCSENLNYWLSPFCLIISNPTSLLTSNKKAHVSNKRKITPLPNYYSISLFQKFHKQLKIVVYSSFFHFFPFHSSLFLFRSNGFCPITSLKSSHQDHHGLPSPKCKGCHLFPVCSQQHLTEVTASFSWSQCFSSNTTFNFSLPSSDAPSQPTWPTPPSLTTYHIWFLWDQYQCLSFASSTDSYWPFHRPNRINHHLWVQNSETHTYNPDNTSDV